MKKKKVLKTKYYLLCSSRDVQDITHRNQVIVSEPITKCFAKLAKMIDIWNQMNSRAQRMKGGEDRDKSQSPFVRLLCY